MKKVRRFKVKPMTEKELQNMEYFHSIDLYISLYTGTQERRLVLTIRNLQKELLKGGL